MKSLNSNLIDHVYPTIYSDRDTFLSPGWNGVGHSKVLCPQNYRRTGPEVLPGAGHHRSVYVMHPCSNQHYSHVLFVYTVNVSAHSQWPYKDEASKRCDLHSSQTYKQTKSSTYTDTENSQIPLTWSTCLAVGLLVILRSTGRGELGGGRGVNSWHIAVVCTLRALCLPYPRFLTASLWRHGCNTNFF